MTTYAGSFHREGNWWVVEVDHVGVTQTRHPHDIYPMARALIGDMGDFDASRVDINLHLATS